ncbi:hypothetical protein GGQ99_000964 [Aminobacter niigataensis]|uniref:Uncharacterized protein n=1 Tax=Aminobacter niigataensis TaxID=83265 RepID=A0ABR6KXP4_9HYPH|nr:hypothetical protein [Aminobacter niigataensis]MBB4649242.1 hypothetical protein [Aminobacter niigataensis]
MTEEAELTKAMIVNWALAEIGLAPSFSIDQETTLGGVVDMFWPRAIGHCFGLHDWTFCRRTSQLTRQAAKPVTGYRYGFDLPGDKIGQPMKLLSDPRRETPIRDSRIEGRTLFADEETVYAVCKVAVDPQIWDWQWAGAFATAFSSWLAVPLLQDIELAAEKRAEAFGTRSEGGTGGVFGRLIAQDRASGPVGSNLLANEPLTSGRFTGDWHGRW